jgi:hypothetical protein
MAGVTTGRRPAMRVPTRATERASVASVLRPCPVANTRALAESFGGTSMTSSPSASAGVGRCAGRCPDTPRSPDPVRPLPTIGQHGDVAVLVGAEPAATEDVLVRGDRLNRCELQHIFRPRGNVCAYHRRQASILRLLVVAGSGVLGVVVLSAQPAIRPHDYVRAPTVVGYDVPIRTHGPR